MTRKIAIYGMLTALTVAVSLVILIPIPVTNGFITLCDAGIYLTALLFGPIGGLAVGAITGGMLDLLAGYPQWILFSLVIHGLQGFIAGNAKIKRPLRLALGCLVMVVGYALATGLLYGTGAGLLSIPTNMIQSIFGAVVAIPLSKGLQQAIPLLKKEGNRG